MLNETLILSYMATLLYLLHYIYMYVYYFIVKYAF